MKRISRFMACCGLAAATLSATAGTYTENRTDFRDETIYFAMTTRFYDGDPTNNVCTWDKQDQQISTKDPAWRGDFAGLIEKLDYIKALGFTAIWITPIVQNGSGIDYHGYHAMDFTNVDLRYESRKEWGADKDVAFQDLIDAAHAKGMKIVLDVVLQHTGNFGEATLNPLFTRNQNIRNQASIENCMKPDNDRLGGAAYWKLDPKTEQYPVRWKYFKNPQYEPNNYYHHYGTGWNWDFPNRWWGQIAGDCVDLNTENDAVAEYIVKCYGTFIEMGVDAFRIDTTGHISPLTFNTQFTQKFHEIANKPEVKAKRLNGIDFYMFGECCQRFQGSVVYRDQPNLSSYFYTWKSDQTLVDEFKSQSSAEWWRAQNLPEGHDTPVGPMAVCESDTKDKSRSNNVKMVNGAWHEPDYSQASGLNVIDFPVHYSFSNVSSVMGLFNQDNYYNDASFNVVYVDSHDYSPGPNDGIRFNGGTAQWAENLSFMFTFRGIPCIYYGSEVEFQKGKVIDDGMQTALNNTGRAYFGHYLEGNVTASDFGKYTATGQVAKTLNGDLAHHIQQLNKIRQAVPALRKGQYTFDGCTANGGWAFKRAYKDSYALVAVNGGATFSNVPAGTYTDIVTGKTYSGGGSITVDAPKTQGQLRVLVKDWTGGKVAEDGKFIYTSSPVSKGGNPTATDPGTSTFYTKADAIDESVGMVFSPNGGSFKTETLTVKVSLSAGSTSGTFKVGNNAQQTISAGETKSFTIGSGMAYGESVSVTWTATGKEGNENGTVTFKKVDPNAAVNIFVKAPSAPHIYAWENVGGTTKKFAGDWPGTLMSETAVVDGTTYYTISFLDVQDSVNIIFNNNNQQTGDITGISGDAYFEYDGATSATEITVTPTEPKVTLSPNGGSFSGTQNVTITANSVVTSAWYKIGNGSQVSFTGSKTFTIGQDMADGTSVAVSWSATGAGKTITGSATFTKTAQTVDPQPDEFVVYWDNSNSTNWTDLHCYYWGGTQLSADWPGEQITEEVAPGIWKHVIADGTTGLIFNNGGNGANQTNDISNPEKGHLYTAAGLDNGKMAVKDLGPYSPPTAVELVPAAEMEVAVINGMLRIISENGGCVMLYDLSGRAESLMVLPGYNYYELPKGFYIVNGKKIIL